MTDLHGTVLFFPATREKVLAALAALPPGSELTKELALQGLKYASRLQDTFTVENDAQGAMYRWCDIVRLLMSERITAVSDPGIGCGFRFRQPVSEIAPITDVAGLSRAEERALVDRVVRPSDAEVIAKRWPRATAKVLTADGEVEISKDALIRYVQFPADVWLVGSQWIVNLERRDKRLPTEESIMERVRQLSDGKHVTDGLLIRDYDKYFQGNEHFMALYTTAHVSLTVTKRYPPGSPDTPYLHFVCTAFRSGR